MNIEVLDKPLIFHQKKKKKPLLEQINELNKLSGYKIYTQKFYFYKLTWNSPKRKLNNPTYNGIKKNKMHWNKLKEAKDLYSEN